jgi:uncharacterized membrane protein YeaQ/YmgE (transglycosylase-associated protein family)
VFFILGLLIVGLLAGAIARLFVGSPERLGCLGTAALGIIGSFVGGSLWSILFYNHFDLRRASTFIGSIVGTIIVLVIWRAVDRRLPPRR